MHRYVMPAHVKDRIVGRMGRSVVDERLDAASTALIVVDMQNYFVAPGFPAEVPMAREIVPAINRAAQTLRAAGGTVVWIQTTKTGVMEHWRNFQTRMLTEERQEARLAGLDEQSEGFRIYPPLDVGADDVVVKKIKYSAFIPHSSSIETELRSRGIVNVLIAGTLTNVCCESTARDAMLLDFRVAMLSDANATLTDEEHAATLNSFAMFFGDVMSVDEAISRLVPSAITRSAAE